MRSIFVLKAALILLAFSLIASAKKSADVTELQIGVKYKPKTCEVQAHKGDSVKVHYRGKLTDGTVFDSSFERGDPIQFELGSGQVIKGWDQGILAMCLGEKRKLKIPSKLGYGEQGSPPTIPGACSERAAAREALFWTCWAAWGARGHNDSASGGATLIFDTELVAVNGKTLNDEKSDDSEL